MIRIWKWLSISILTAAVSPILACGGGGGPDPCESVTCSGQGTCGSMGGIAFCRCNEGYHSEGLECVKNPDSCDDVSCSDHGTCVDIGDSVECDCDPGYRAVGLNCIEEGVDLCEGITCSYHGHCVDERGIAECVCDEGYHPIGLECVQSCIPGELDCSCDNGSCNDDLVCENDVCIERGECCPGHDLYITLSGVVKTIAQVPAEIDLAPLSPMAVLASGDLSGHLAETSSNADGEFSFDCFDVADVLMGMIMLADDTGFDGTGGEYYPTLTGIAGWESDEDKVCIDEAPPVYVMEATMHAALTAALGMDPDTDGYVIGMVLDADRVPLGGATVKRGDGSALDLVYYPNADFTDMGATTDPAHGIYIIPGPLTLTTLIGVLDGYTWDNVTYRAAAIPGAAYFVPVVAEPQ